MAIENDNNLTANKKKSVVEQCEELYPETCKEFKRIQYEQYALFCAKNMDYGPGNIALGTSLEKANQRAASITGVVIRLADKVNRLLNLVVVNQRSPENESVMDTFDDISIYPIIAKIVYNGKWGK